MAKGSGNELRRGGANELRRGGANELRLMAGAGNERLSLAGPGTQISG